MPAVGVVQNAHVDVCHRESVRDAFYRSIHTARHDTQPDAGSRPNCDPVAVSRIRGTVTRAAARPCPQGQTRRVRRQARTRWKG
jgi:hypothetical protein